MSAADAGTPARAASWSDNDVVASLDQLSRALDTVAGAIPEDFSDNENRRDEPLPLQNLPAHLIFARHWEMNRGKWLSKLVSRACPLCGTNERFTWFATQDGYRYDVCSACGIVHIPEVLPLTVWDEYYATLPSARECLLEQLQRSVADEAFESDRTRFGRYITLLRSLGTAAPGDRLLDLGSFTGGSLRVAAEHGLQAFGVEGLTEAVRFAHAQFPSLRLEHARTEHLDPGVFGGRFDVVTMWETLEHTFEPLTSLRLAAQALRPGGIVAVSVPNASNVQFSALGPFCFYAYGGYHGTGHINMFTPATLRRALAAVGFDTLHISTEFGTDWRQVLYYLRHRFDRIHCYANLIRRSLTTDTSSPATSVLLNWLSPSLTRLENSCLAGPILIAVGRLREGA